VKDYVRAASLRQREMFVPLTPAPGTAQADFGEALVIVGGEERKAHFFAIDLPHSDNILVLHYADLSESDVQTAQGFKFTRPLRTILDLIEAGTVERNFIRQALRQAVDRGLITRQQIRNTQMR